MARVPERPRPGQAIESGRNSIDEPGPVRPPAEPPPPVEDRPGPPIIRGGGDECCCEDITLYLTSVKVVDRTDAPIPLLGGILGTFVDDRVFVLAKSCDGSRFKWPTEAGNQKCAEGVEVAINAPLATIKPDSSCRVNCSVEIQAYRASRVSELIDAIIALGPELKAAAEAYLMATTGVSAALAALQAATTSPLAATLVPQATADVQAATQARDGAMAKRDSLEAKLKALEKALFGTGDALMGDFFINFRGPLTCDSNLKESVPAPTDGTATSKEKVQFVHTMRNNGGVWQLTLTAIKTCYRK